MPDNSVPESFDWDEIKSRLERAQRSVSSAENLSEEQIKELMKKRAEQLARVPEKSIDTSELLEVVRFRIGSEEVAIETRYALQLVTLNHVTPIPDTEDFFLGVCNLRGEVATVIDLGRFLGITTETAHNPQALVLGIEKPDCAILVDRIEHVKTIRKQDILEPSGGLGNFADLLIGCTPDAVMIIDGQALLECDRLCIDQKE